MACSDDAAVHRAQSAADLMYIKEDLILPKTLTFYELISTRARGKSGPLFHFDVHEDLRLQSDARVEKDESHAGVLVPADLQSGTRSTSRLACAPCLKLALSLARGLALSLSDARAEKDDSRAGKLAIRQMTEQAGQKLALIWHEDLRLASIASVEEEEWHAAVLAAAGSQTSSEHACARCQELGRSLGEGHVPASGCTRGQEQAASMLVWLAARGAQRSSRRACSGHYACRPVRAWRRAQLTQVVSYSPAGLHPSGQACWWWLRSLFGCPASRS